MLQLLPFHVQAADSQLCIVHTGAHVDGTRASLASVCCLLVRTCVEKCRIQRLSDVYCRMEMSIRG